MWEQDRDGLEEVFTLATNILAVDGATAVVRAEGRYGDPLRQDYRDLWVIRLRDDGRSSWFAECPYWPGRPYSARDHHEASSLCPGPRGPHAPRRPTHS